MKHEGVTLPDQGQIPMIKTFMMDDQQQLNLKQFRDARAGNDSIYNTQQIGKKKTAILYPKSDSADIVNEYTTRNVCSGAFPTLFPYGEKCPFDNDILTIPEKEQPTPEAKLLRLCNFREIIKDKPRNRFQEHPYFMYYCFNRVMRAKTKIESKLFFKGLNPY